MDPKKIKYIMSKDYFKRKTCRLCNSSALESVLKFNSTPPANAFVTKNRLNFQQKTYPLEVFFCNDCKHVQLLDIVNPSILFKDYVYVSGTSPIFRNHFEDYTVSLINEFNPSPEELIIDIGSNDGTLLSCFKSRGFKILGIDPAKDIAKEANKKGLETINDFFDFELSNYIKVNFPRASIITANNVFAHCDDLIGIVKGVKNLLSEDGIFIFEVSYLVDVLEKTLFDTIYHEHLSYHSVIPLIKFFGENGMELFKVERINTHGGSIRGYARKSSNYSYEHKSIKELIYLEEKMATNKKQTLVNYSTKINDLKVKLNQILIKLKLEGKKIGAFGAPAKATTLMYQFGLDKSLIDFIVDDSPLKQGLFSPGLHIPVLSSNAIKSEKPDYLLLLAWNFADSIINKNKDYIESGGHFIVPLPQITIV